MRIRQNFLMISIFCIYIPQVYCQDTSYIKLPFDFFYGRWVDGHLGKMNSKYMNRRKPDYTGSYSLTSGNSYFAISNIQKYLLVSERTKVWESATLAYSKRIKSKWQFGLDRLSFYKSDNVLQRAETNQLNIFDRSSSTITGSISSNFVNNDTLKILGSSGAYSYYFEPIFSAGTVRLDNIVDLVYQRNSDEWFSFADSGYIRQSVFYGRSFYDWSFRSTLLWGAKDFFNFVASLNISYRTVNQKLYEIFDYPNQNPSQEKIESRDRELIPVVSFFSSGGIRKNMYFKAVYTNVYIGQDRHVNRIYNYQNSDSIVFNKYVYESTLQSRQWLISGSFRFINSNSFENAIILDDYSGYYKKMLFKDQLLIDFELSSLHDGHFYEVKGKDSKIRLRSDYGLSNKINIGGVVVYELQERHQINKTEAVNSSFLMRYRSYAFNKGFGSGWDQDNKYDQVLGQILKFGQWYAEVRYDLPQLNNYPKLNLRFFSFSKLEWDEFHTLKFSLQIGLGKKTAITLNDEEYYYSNDTPHRVYRIGIVNRFIEQIGINFTYNQVYSSSKYRDPSVEVSIQAFL